MKFGLDFAFLRRASRRGEINKNNLADFLFTDDLKLTIGSKYYTGKEAALGQQILKQAKQLGRPLGPAEVFSTALYLNDHCALDAILTCNNYIKQQCYEYRKVKADLNQIAQDQKNQANLVRDLQARGVLDTNGKPVPGKSETPQAKKALGRITKLQNSIKDTQDWVSEHQQAVKTFAALRTLRTRTDNEGAWYHLFTTMTLGFASLDSAEPGIAVWGEHRVYKRAEHRAKGGNFDPVEYCWDTWGADLGGEIWSSIIANQERVKQILRENPRYFEKFQRHDASLRRGNMGQKQPR